MSEKLEESSSTPEGGGAAAAAARPPALGGRGLLYTAGALVVLLALLLAAVVVRNRITLRRLEGTLETQRTEMTEARQRALDTQGREILRLAGLPLAWAVRGEVLKDNLQQVDDYFRRFVKEPGVQSLLYVDKEGRIVIATDRKLEGQAAAGLVSTALIEATEVTLEENPPGIRLAVPIMAFEARAGVLLLDYVLRDPAAPPAPAAPPGN